MITRSDLAMRLRDVVERFRRCASNPPTEYILEVQEIEAHLAAMERLLAQQIDQIQSNRYDQRNTKRREPYVYDDPRFRRPDPGPGSQWGMGAAARRRPTR
jgi:hypothetical protein